MNFRKVTREEYREFVQSYPRQLRFDCTGICEPPVGTYNDFALADKWPDSVVAKEVYDYPREYFIRMDIAERTSNSSDAGEPSG